jgi:hypothetical protein
MSKHIGNNSGPVDAAGIGGKRMLLPGEISIPGKMEKSSEVIVDKANRILMKPVLVVSRYERLVPKDRTLTAGSYRKCVSSSYYRPTTG